mmetsp:Transcript_115550/g.290763  ORF Transcript_115550/g.290763 Transcript_115550/m.290763 type:complete len:221 (-) Transcript_115550:467-1129(-)
MQDRDRCSAPQRQQQEDDVSEAREPNPKERIHDDPNQHAETAAILLEPILHQGAIDAAVLPTALRGFPLLVLKDRAVRVPSNLRVSAHRHDRGRGCPARALRRRSASRRRRRHREAAALRSERALAGGAARPRLHLRHAEPGPVLALLRQPAQQRPRPGAAFCHGAVGGSAVGGAYRLKGAAHLLLDVPLVAPLHPHRPPERAQRPQVHRRRDHAREQDL